MPARSQAVRRRSVPLAVVLSVGLLAGAALPSTAHAVGAGSREQTIGGSRDHREQTIGGSRDHRQISGGSRAHRGALVVPTHPRSATMGVRAAG